VPEDDVERAARHVRAFSALLVALVLVGPLVVLDPDSPLGVGLPLLVELVATAVLVVVALRMPRGPRVVWGCLALTLVLTTVGDVVYDVQQYHFHDVPFPGWADPIYLATYVPEVIALVVLVRSRHPHFDRAQWLDSAIITTPVAAVVGVYVLIPLADGGGVDLSSVVAMAYPVMDVVVLAGLIRLLVGGGLPSRSLSLLSASVATTLAADLSYNGLAAEGIVDSTPGWMNALFSLGMVLMAFASLAPGAAQVRDPAPESDRVISSPRAVAIGLGTLALPVLIAVGVRTDLDVGTRLLAVSSIAVNTLVVWRAVILLDVIKTQREDLARVARTDALTGLPNRRSWEFELDRAVDAALAASTPLTIAMLDLDGFKALNDREGHPAGDKVLEACAVAWREVMPGSAYLARYGGDEFGLLLPGLDGEEVAAVLERVRLATPAEVTVSIGYSRHRIVDEDHHTIADADLALYAAKAAGRDRVVTFDGGDRVRA
jgi:diguanylate cyclase (GGDEF)-like protein